MFKHELAMESPICPDCGCTLRSEHTSLRCDAHGTFFIYGPYLLVRCAPEPQEQPVISLLPWQTMTEHNASPAKQSVSSSV